MKSFTYCLPIYRLRRLPAPFCATFLFFSLGRLPICTPFLCCLSPSFSVSPPLPAQPVTLPSRLHMDMVHILLVVVVHAHLSLVFSAAI